MDLGIQIEPQFGFTFEDVLAIAHDGEAAGFSRLWLSDHFFFTKDAVDTACLEAWTLLAALAGLGRRPPRRAVGGSPPHWEPPPPPRKGPPVRVRRAPPP